MPVSDTSQMLLLRIAVLAAGYPSSLAVRQIFIERSPNELLQLLIRLLDLLQTIQAFDFHSTWQFQMPSLPLMTTTGLSVALPTLITITTNLNFSVYNRMYMLIKRAKVYNASFFSRRWWKHNKCQLSHVTANMYLFKSSLKQLWRIRMQPSNFSLFNNQSTKHRMKFIFQISACAHPARKQKENSRLCMACSTRLTKKSRLTQLDPFQTFRLILIYVIQLWATAFWI